MASMGMMERTNICRQHTHTHTLKTTRSQLTHLSISPSVFLTPRISICLSLDSRCVAWISSPQHFILIRHNIYPQFNRLRCCVLQALRGEQSVCMRVCVCVSLCFSCRADETDQLLRAMCTLFIKLQTPLLLNNYFAGRNSFKHIVELVQMLSLVCLPNMFYS